jgi:hypothetical protein
MFSLNRKIEINVMKENIRDIKNENCTIYLECKLNLGSKIDKSYLKVENTNNMDKNELNMANPPKIDGA